MRRTPALVIITALATGPALAESTAEVAPRGPDADVEEETWTWFGMGFENRHRVRGGNQDGFGPESRPSGGFGVSRGTGGLGGGRDGSSRGNGGAGRGGR